MAERDYYAELGLPRTASADEIGRAFRRLAAQHHPDRNPGDKQAEERFKRVAEAYNVLSDPKSRAAYDRGGAPRVEADTGFRGFDSTEDVFSRFGDVFGDLFGERMRRRAPAPRDFEVELPLTPLEAERGARKTLTVELPRVCEGCGGKSTSCPDCRGSGFVSKRAREAGGFFSVSTPCPRCGGSGVDPSTACARCGGRGVELRPRTIELTIPPKTEDGAVLRLRGMGAPGLNGAAPGDLRVRVRVKAPAAEEVEVEIDLPTAALGGKVDVGAVEMTLPAGTQPGQRFRLAGQGRSGGDLYVTVRVRIPTRLSEDERRLLEGMRGGPAGRR